MLIIDGHSSHVNIAFIAAADDQRIILLILPPHSTHRLQPLDVGLFSPLAKAYTKGLNDLMFHSLGLVSINKQLFWGLFRSAWDSAFTKENITSSFEAIGISPFNLSRILIFLAIQKLITSPSSAASPPKDDPHYSGSRDRPQRSRFFPPRGKSSFLARSRCPSSC